MTMMTNQVTKKHPNDEEREEAEPGRVGLSSRCPLIAGPGFAKPEIIMIMIVILLS